MKEAMKYAMAMAVSAAAMFAYMREAPPEGAVQEVTQKASSQNHSSALPDGSKQKADQPKRELTAAELADIDPASIDWESMKARYADIAFGEDPMLTGFWVHITDFTPEEIAAYNKLHVVPLNPAIGQECGLMRMERWEAYDIPESVTNNCTPVYERPEHPYKSLSIQELRELVEFNNDAEAAVMASRNTSDSNEAIDFAIRASVLTGKSGPILQAARWASLFSVVEGRSSDQIIADAARHLVLENIAARMGDPRAQPDYENTIYALIDQGLSQEEIESVKQDIKASSIKILREMGEQQRELTGATGILELTNA